MHGDTIRIEHMDGELTTYAALSYCWGDSASMEVAKTTQSNLAARLQGFQLDQLPATLRDAIALTQKQGIRYIWIDALCIVQDCHDEWEAEAGKMMAYYGKAYVTIVPKLSGRAGDGF
ncbi:heterokaryon incompatibility protein-domain-containing protein, partial [Podospora aff. communis PSN243]